MKKNIILSLLALSLFVTGCGTSTSSSQDDGKVTGITTNVESLKILKNKKGFIDAEVTNKSAINKELTYEITKGSDVISLSNGVITGLKVGEAEITIKAQDDSGVSKIIPVSIINQENYYSEAFESKETTFTYRDAKKDRNIAPSLGNQKILVIPVCMSDDTARADDYNINLIKKAYSGTKEECGWMSLKDYYYNASYGQLNYDVKVADEWYHLPSKYTTSWVNENRSEELAPLALKWFKETYPDYDLSSFDSDNNGIIDNVHIVYNVSFTTWGSGLWAQCTATLDEVNTDLKIGPYIFYSLRFLRDKNMSGGVPENGINTRTIIHENGHMLGLDDYYDYLNQAHSAANILEMQAGNVLDWNIFSKYSVGWVKPTFVNEKYLKEHKSAKITLSSSGFDGDCLIIKNSNLMGIPFDEYLILELFNPDTTNNYYDTHSNTDENVRNLGYGVKIYHVDARMVQGFYNEELKDVIFDYVTKDTFARTDYEIRELFTNNSSKTVQDKTIWPYNKLEDDAIYYRLLHLLQKEGYNTFNIQIRNSRSHLVTSDLWQTGDTFSIGNHDGYKNYGTAFFQHQTTFNDKSNFPYGLVFDEVTPNSATITINYFE